MQSEQSYKSIFASKMSDDEDMYEDIECYFKAIDKNKDGFWDIDEFSTFMEEKFDEDLNPEHIELGFSMIDTSGKGHITLNYFYEYVVECFKKHEANRKNEEREKSRELLLESIDISELTKSRAIGSRMNEMIQTKNNEAKYNANKLKNSKGNKLKKKIF